QLTQSFLFLDHTEELAVDERFAFDELMFLLLKFVSAGGEGLFGLLLNPQGLLFPLQASFAEDSLGTALGFFQHRPFSEEESGLDIALFPAPKPVARHRTHRDA